MENGEQWMMDGAGGILGWAASVPVILFGLLWWGLRRFWDAVGVMMCMLCASILVLTATSYFVAFDGIVVWRAGVNTDTGMLVMFGRGSCRVDWLSEESVNPTPYRLTDVMIDIGSARTSVYKAFGTDMRELGFGFGYLDWSTVSMGSLKFRGYGVLVPGWLAIGVLSLPAGTWVWRVRRRGSKAMGFEVAVQDVREGRKA